MLQPHRLTALAFLLSAPACSADLADVSAPLAPAPGTYVLTSMGPASGAPFITLDLECGPARVRTQYMTLGDTITIGEDGTAREAFALATFRNGLKTDSTYLALEGSWMSINSTGTAYYGGHSSFQITIRTGASSAVTNTYRIEGDGSVSRLDGTGGSCAGDVQAVQRFASIWTRI
jgi:hypothetical protein